MKNQHLTQKSIAALPVPVNGNRLYYDDDVKGFACRITKSGAKSFVLNYRVDGRERRITIGEVGNWTASAARDHASKLRRSVDSGTDPLGERQRRRTANTVNELVNEYIERHAKPKKKSWNVDKRILDKELIPGYGTRSAESIEKREIVGLLDDIVDRGAPVMANRTLACIRRVFKFAVEKDILKYSPVTHIKAPAKEKSRERVLTADEIKTAWNGLTGPIEYISDDMLRALKLVLVTGQRPGEVIGMRHSEIEGIWWTIPGERIKNGLTHRVALSTLALELIDQCDSDGDLLFPSPRGDQSIETNAMSHALRRIDFDIEHFTPHDLRRTMGTNLGRLGFNRLIQDKVLNHKDATMGGVYDRYSYDVEKRQALDAWANELREIIDGAQKRSKIAGRIGGSNG